MGPGFALGVVNKASSNPGGGHQTHFIIDESVESDSRELAPRGAQLPRGGGGLGLFGKPWCAQVLVPLSRQRVVQKKKDKGLRSSGKWSTSVFETCTENHRPRPRFTSGIGKKKIPERSPVFGLPQIL